jgi:hypothetical protein
MRWNLVAGHGQQAADHFLACYQAITSTPLSDQPYWDLVALLDLLLDTGDPAGPGDIGPDDVHRFENYAKRPSPAAGDRPPAPAAGTAAMLRLQRS